MLLLRLAFRNILRQKRRSLLTGISLMLGFILCSLSIGISEGSYSNIITLFTKQMTGHVQIHKKGFLLQPSLYKTIPNPEKIFQTLENSEKVAGYTKRVLGSALASGKDKTTGAPLRGVDVGKENIATGIGTRVEKGQYLDATRPKDVLIGPGLAEILQIDVGSELILISQGADGSIANDLFRVRGILQGDVDSLDRVTVYLPLAGLQEFLSLGDRIHEVSVLLAQERYSRPFAKTLSEKVDPQVEVHPWQLVEEDFYRAMTIDKNSNLFTLGVILFIVALGVLNTVLMTLLERTREFGLLKAMGTRPRLIAGIMILETATLALISVLLGTLLALPAHSYFMTTGIPLPEPVTIAGFTFQTMRSEITVWTLVLPGLVTVLTAIVVSLFPAYRATQVSPTEAMRAV